MSFMGMQPVRGHAAMQHFSVLPSTLRFGRGIYLLGLPIAKLVLSLSLSLSHYLISDGVAVKSGLRTEQIKPLITANKICWAGARIPQSSDEVHLCIHSTEMSHLFRLGYLSPARQSGSCPIPPKGV